MSFISWIISENESLTTCQSRELCLWEELASRVPLPPQPSSPRPAHLGSCPPAPTALSFSKEPWAGALARGRDVPILHLVPKILGDGRKSLKPNPTKSCSEEDAGANIASVELCKRLFKPWGLVFMHSALCLTTLCFKQTSYSLTT